jgi:hypothetical protein
MRNIPIQDSQIDFNKPVAGFTLQDIPLTANLYVRSNHPSYSTLRSNPLQKYSTLGNYNYYT